MLFVTVELTLIGSPPTCLKKLDGLRPLILHPHLVLLHHVVLDLLVALIQRLQLQQNPLGEVRDARRRGRLGVRQVHINHEDVREHAGRRPNQRE